MFSDDTGAHVFTLTKDLTKIGRGGEDYWVDVTLTTGTKVSREHCHIRRDPSGAYLLRDVSSWGTKLNGQPLAKYVEGDPAAPEYALNDGASILLADAVMIEFRLQ
jgi:pSer/pThr/pTyr-binding forkhead associated (FHA) protein